MPLPGYDMISLNDFKLICQTTRVVKTVLVLMITGLFLYDSYLYFQGLPTYIDQIIHLNSPDKNPKFYIHYFMTWGIMLFWCIVKIVIIKLVYRFIISLPVPKSWLGKWYDNQEIGPILGRMLVHHLRVRNHIKIKTLSHYVAWSQEEAYYFNQHRQNPHLNKIFKEFDGAWQQDNHWLDN